MIDRITLAIAAVKVLYSSLLNVMRFLPFIRIKPIGPPVNDRLSTISKAEN